MSTTPVHNLPDKYLQPHLTARTTIFFNQELKNELRLWTDLDAMRATPVRIVPTRNEKMN
jgi:hypothetical protein